MSEWINIIQYINTIQFYSARNKNEVMLFAGQWLDLKIIMLREMSQSHKENYLLFFHTWNLVEVEGHESNREY
jgi:hypothetical protein